VAPQTQQKLLQEIGNSRAMGIDSFPSLALADVNGDLAQIRLSYNNVEAMLDQIETLIG
jgi:protein-disulfide isomerase-like protein with CxxC motif